MTDATKNSYLRDAILTASQEQLHLMLLDGAIRFALQAKDALIEKDFEVFFDTISRARAIIVELQAGLRPDVQPELCDRMRAIYNFIYRNLNLSSSERNPQRIDDAVRVLQAQRETWELIVKKVAAIDTTAIPNTPKERSVIQIVDEGQECALNLEG